MIDSSDCVREGTMAIDLNTELTPIDPTDGKYRGMLANLQGNILKGHGRDYTAHIFVQFTADVATVRKELSTLADEIVTSAHRQHTESREYKDFKIPGALFGSIALSASGYQQLEFSDDQMKRLFVDGADVQAHFLEGMKAHGAELNDPVPGDWEPRYNTGRIDAMILLADDDEGFLLRRAREVMNKLASFCTIHAVERGKALRTDEGEGIEHFGYVDGRSQPIFFSTDMEAEGDTSVWDPGAPLKLVLVPDASTSEPDAFGSYFVFRKLEQDVRRFTVREHELADHLELVGRDRERAGAMAVGRFRDGTPLTLSQTDGFLPTKENNFTFATDLAGGKCPFHAHIRKTNPRGDVVRKHGVTDAAERLRRIARRGITYGDRKRDLDEFQALDDLPTEGVGLLFMCFQASIARQFAFMQSSWANNNTFINDDTGPDPIIAQKVEGSEAVSQNWPKAWTEGAGATKAFSFGEFVKMKGGEFFFAPSIPFLRTLKPPAARN